MSGGREQMLHCYLRVATRSWDDAEFNSRLSESPREALAEEGWELPPGTAVSVRFLDGRDLARQPAPDEVAAAWERGIEEGELKVAFFDSPAPLVELSDSELDQISGGSSDPAVPAGFVIPL